MKSRGSMLAVAELYTRVDIIDESITDIDGKLRMLVNARQELHKERAHIMSGIDAIGSSSGLFVTDQRGENVNG